MMLNECAYGSARHRVAAQLVPDHAPDSRARELAVMLGLRRRR
jgi:hypothetical protein